MLNLFIRVLLAALLLCLGPAALAQDFPALGGRVVDQADLLNPQQEAALTAKLEALERATTRQLVVATVRSLQDRPIEDYGYQLGRHWGIGQNQANNGTILLVAPVERKVRIEVGYGLEGILTDALSSRIIRDAILPRFRDNDYPGGITAGVDAVVAQLQAPPEVAEQRVLEAAQQERQRQHGSPSWMGIAFVGIVVLVVLIGGIAGGISGRRRGRFYRRRGGGLGSVILWSAIGNAIGGASRGGGSSWGGGGGGGFGGFSGGGGSFGGGGASGSW